MNKEYSIPQKRFIPSILTILLMSFLVSSAIAQPSWKRDKKPVQKDLALFPSTMTANFPTSETLARGDFEYEISHRFLPTINDGYQVYWGIDGPAQIRTALSYGITNRLMVTLGRSNLLDNLDLRLKMRLFEIRSSKLPSIVALQAGLAWNLEIPNSIGRGKASPENLTT